MWLLKKLMSLRSIEHPDDESIETYLMDNVAEPLRRVGMKLHIGQCVECHERVRDLELYHDAMRTALKEFCENQSG